ncbi:MAG: DUF4870 domain-containing protein [Pirellulales bacterium]
MSGSPLVPPNADDKMWAMLAHLSFFVLGIIGPLVIWIVKKEKSPYVEDQAKEALNFQLAVTIVAMVSAMTIVLIPFAMIAMLGGMIYSVLAAVEANNGNYYRYPYTLRLIK